jgi:hypothetical protein
MLLCLVSCFIYGYAECHYAECHYAECHYAECSYAENRYAECRHAECRYGWLSRRPHTHTQPSVDVIIIDDD